MKLLVELLNTFIKKEQGLYNTLFENFYYIRLMNSPKKYVAKWLPTEGEIKEGDYYMFFSHGIYSRRQHKWFGREWNLHQKGKSAPLFERMYKLFDLQDVVRVKLFLCSYDIQPGDEYFFMTHDQEYVKTLTYKEGPISDHWFKKLNKISKEAVWVMENDEFTQDEVQGYNDFMEYAVYPVEQGLTATASSYIRILNHSCKHFH